MDADPAERTRPAALRVVGPRDDGNDPQSLADRSRPTITNVLEEDATAVAPLGNGGRGPARAVRDRDRRGQLRCEAPVDGADGARTSHRGREAAQPVFSDYWLHNKGAAPMGYQAVTVQIKPSILGGEGPYQLADRGGLGADRRRSRGLGRVIVPPGWEADARRSGSTGSRRAHTSRSTPRSGRRRRRRPRSLLRGRPDHG